MLWLLAGIALAAAATAFLRTRRIARRLEGLSDSYWELRYEYGQLNARLNRLEAGESAGDVMSKAQPPSTTVGFVPISSLKKQA